MRMDKSQARLVMHQLIDKYHLDQEELFRYGLIEKIKDGYLVAIYRGYQVSVNKYPF